LILRDPNFEDNKFIVCTDCPQETYLTPTGNGSGLTGLTTSQITNLSSYTGLDVRYFTETETDVRYLRKDANNNYANLLRYTSSGSVHNDAVRSFYGTDSDFSIYFSGGTNSAVIDLISASSLIIRDNGTNRVEITDSGTLTATNFILSSDKRLKENFHSLGNGYYSFNFKDNPNEKRYGVIAQEVKKYAPELVSEGDDGYLKVAYIDLLIKKIAELEARVKELEKK